MGILLEKGWAGGGGGMGKKTLFSKAQIPKEEDGEK